MKVALYARVSIGEVSETRIQDPEMQLRPMREHCKMMGWEIVKEFIDIETGSSKLRPQFREMLNLASSKSIETILVWKLDRLTRLKALDAMLLIDELRKRGVGLKSITENWMDTTSNNPTAGLLLYIVSWIAEQERANISARVKAGIANKKATGQWKGGRPKGKKDGQPRTRRWERKPDVDVRDLFR